MYIKQIPIAFHNGFNYDYHFIIKDSEFTSLGENTQKYITFIPPIERKITKIDKNGEKITKNMSYVLQVIDGTGFMASSLLNLVNNLFEGIHKIKFK